MKKKMEIVEPIWKLKKVRQIWKLGVWRMGAVFAIPEHQTAVQSWGESNGPANLWSLEKWASAHKLYLSIHQSWGIEDPDLRCLPTDEGKGWEGFEK